MEQNAADTLDRIRVGAGNLLLTAQHRIVEVKQALDEGRFTDAMQAAHSLNEKLSHLAYAQEKMGLLGDNNRIVRVGELENGMVVPGVGEISEVGPCPGCGDDHNVSFTVAGSKMVLDRDLEMVVELPQP